MLNASLAWKGLNLAVTAQSGHWENGAVQKCQFLALLPILPNFNWRVKF